MSADPAGDRAAGDGSAAEGTDRFQKLILVGCDFSQPAAEAISEAARIAKQENGRVKLVFCLDNDIPPQLAFGAHDRILDQHRRSAEEKLLQLGEERLAGVPFDTLVVEGSPRRQLNKIAKTEGADLVVLASRGHSLAAGLLLGSTAESVARHSPCSVLLMR